MAGVIVTCRAEDCPVSLVNRPLDPKPMQLVQEFFSAWHFQCTVCKNHRIVTKDQIGGTLGQGRRDDGTGPTTAKGPNRYRALGGVLQPPSAKGLRR